MRAFKLFDQLFGNGPARRRPAPRCRPRLEGLEDRKLMSISPTDFRVNADTSRSVVRSDNASSVNGMSVAVWEFNTTNTNGDIRAQLYNANGSKRGAEIKVSTSSLSDSDPSVAMDATGDFVVSWVRFVNGQSDVLAQRYSSNGAKLGGVIQVANSSKFESRPDVAMDASGDFVVAWTHRFSSTDEDVKAARFNEAGTRVQSINVSLDSGADEDDASVAMTPNGRFAIAYTYDKDGATNPDVRLKRYSSSGNFQSLIEVAKTGGTEQDPSVSLDDLGNGVVAYEVAGGPNLKDVRARRFTSSGALNGGEILVGNFFNRDEFDPEVALKRTGGEFVVAYDFKAPDGRSTARVTEIRANNSFGAEHVVETPGDLNFDVAISMGNNGNFFLTHTRNAAGPGGLTIRGRRGDI